MLLDLCLETDFCSGDHKPSTQNNIKEERLVGILLSNKKEQTIDTHYNLDESPGFYAELKKPISKGHMLYDSIFYKDGEQMNGYQVQGVSDNRRWGR